METLIERSVNFQEKISKISGLDLSVLSSGALKHALLHPSLANELSLNTEYERLEFLGDSIINAIMASELYKEFSTSSEGNLSKMRSVLVSNEKLGQLSEFIGLMEYVTFSKDENAIMNENTAVQNGKTPGRAFESLFGALYLELGFDRTRDVLVSIIGAWEKINNQRWFHQEQLLSKDVKSRLQEKLHQLGLDNPQYFMVDKFLQHGQENFSMALMIKDTEFFRASATSKKDAEKIIAKNILENWDKYLPQFEELQKGVNQC